MRVIKILAVLALLAVFGITVRRQVAVTTHYIATFFDVYLKGAASELQNQPEYPEI